MTIDPRITFWFGAWTSVLLLVASGTINFTGALPELWVPVVTKWCGILGAINSTILTAASGYSSNKSGPMVSTPMSFTPTIVKVLLVAFALSFLVASNQAQAAEVRRPAITGNIAADIKTDLAGGVAPGAPGQLLTGNPEKDMQALWKKITSASITDLNYAAAMAKNANTTTSGVRLQCLAAIIQLNQQASGAALKNPDGSAMTRPDPSLFTDVESLAEIIDNLSPQGPLFVSCAGAAQLAKTNVLSFVNAVVTGAAGFAAMPVIPGL